MEIESELARYRTHNSWLFLPLRSRGRGEISFFFCSFVCLSRLWSERSIHTIDMCVVFRSSLFLWSFHPLVAVGRSICGTHWAKINGRTFLTDKQKEEKKEVSSFSFSDSFLLPFWVPMSQNQRGRNFPPVQTVVIIISFIFPRTFSSVVDNS